MTQDPIVDEVRAARDELASEYDYDVDAVFDALREMERASGRPVVSLPSRPPFPDIGEKAVDP